MQINFVYVCSNGDRYEGDWVNDKRQGHGEERLQDGTIYDVRLSEIFDNCLHFKNISDIGVTFVRKLVSV